MEFKKKWIWLFKKSWIWLKKMNLIQKILVYINIQSFIYPSNRSFDLFLFKIFAILFFMQKLTFLILLLRNEWRDRAWWRLDDEEDDKSEKWLGQSAVIGRWRYWVIFGTLTTNLLREKLSKRLVLNQARQS